MQINITRIIGNDTYRIALDWGCDKMSITELTVDEMFELNQCIERMLSSRNDPSITGVKASIESVNR